jgi:murein DD-endopeptidase MepM/ murein hydrolase activator NlpD
VHQKLYIPGVAQAREVATRCPCGPTTAKVSKNSSPSSPAIPEHRTAQVIKEVFAPANLRQAPLMSKGMSVIWPVQGEISRNFEQDGPRRHDGIDITAPQGTPIVAAADGKVLFSDWGPGGYGLLVILRHEDDMVTIYAHNDQNLVEVDQNVRQGEPIATVGHSGRATGNHLHFEIRHRTVPIPPYKFLPPQHQNIALLDASANATRLYIP